VVLVRGYRRIGIDDLMAVATQPELAPLVALVVGWRDDVPVERSTEVYQIIALGAVGGADQVQAALMVVAAKAETISAAHAAAILGRCLIFAGQPINPYQPPGLPLQAKVTAVALLQEHPELDVEIYARLRPNFERAALEVMAVALRGRPSGRPSAVVEVLRAWRPSVADAQSFAKECDVRYQSLAIATPRPVRIWPSLPGWQLVTRHAGPFISAPLIALVFAFSAAKFELVKPPFDPGLAEVLIAFGVLVTVHVVAAELSANRLPGILARHTSFPPSLWFSYGAAFTLLLSVGVSKVRPSTPVSWSTNILAGLLVMSVFLVITALLRRTDPATAAQDFVDVRRHFSRQAGRYFGRIRRDAEVLRDLAAGLSFVRLVIAPAKTERRAVIAASDRGFFVPAAGKLKALARSDLWNSGRLTLSIAANLGTIVNGREEIGAVVPDYETAIPRRELRRAARVLHVRPIRGVEQVGEAATSLVEMLDELSSHGNMGGAERVGESLLALLQDHLLAVRHENGRGDGSREQISPVVPALRACVRALMSSLAHTRSRSQEALLTEIIGKILQLGTRGEDVPVMVVADFNELASAPTAASKEEPLIRDVSLRSLETSDQGGLLLVQKAIEDRLRDAAGGFRPTAVQIAAELCSNAVWLDYRLAPNCWRWYWRITNDQQAGGGRVLGAVRVGAAGLLSGTISIATDVAMRLRELNVNFGQIRTLLSDPAIIAREQAISDLGGGYLGTSAGDALLGCVDFCADTAAAVT
jgi:hypothetical protein